MNVKTTMRRLKNAQISFISLVNRGANRIPFRVLKSEGENQMLDLARILKNEPAQVKPQGFAAILKADPFRASKAAPTQAPQPVAKAAATPQAAKAAAARQTTQQAQRRQQVAEERQRQGLAPNQPLHTTPAPRRAGNTPKQPAPARDTVTLKELRAEVDSALAHSRKQDEQEQFNAKRSAFAQIAPTRQDQVPQGGRGDAWSLRNHGAQLAMQLLGGTDKPLPANTAFRPFSAAGTQA